ncbi:hypothetical protein Tco_1044871 [Tanacetum coccineum]|uniref:Uncharacterized protein n=1 Tax=Tanacetum coccineum TaxID=301880 RepID=A0ABQ5GSF2_9ASTR
MAVHISLAVFTCINTTGRMFSAAINCCKSTFVVNMDRQNVTSLDIHPFDLVSRYPRKPRMPTENIFPGPTSVDGSFEPAAYIVMQLAILEDVFTGVDMMND